MNHRASIVQVAAGATCTYTQAQANTKRKKKKEKRKKKKEKRKKKAEHKKVLCFGVLEAVAVAVAHKRQRRLPLFWRR